MFTTTALEQAVRYSRQAIALDPNYAKAYVSLGGALMFLGGAGPADHVSPRKAYPEAKAALTKALELDDELSEAHMMIGAMRTWFERDWVGANQAFEAALALDPHNVDWHYYRAQSYWVSNELDAAMHHATQAVHADPLSLVFPSFVGHLNYCLRRYDAAIEQFEQVLRREPQHFHAHLHLGDVYLALGELSKAETAWQRAHAVVGEDSSYLLARQVALSTAMGRRDEATRRVEALEERARRRYTPPGFLAIAYLRSGNHDRMFEVLETAVEEGMGLPCIWPTFPWCDPIRSHPRFRVLLRKMNLPQAG